MHEIRITLLTMCSAVLLSLPSVAHAHHEGIWHSFRIAHSVKDYRELRPIFTDDAWEGKTGEVAGKELNEMTRRATSVEFNPGARMESRERGVMGLRFVDRDGQSSWVYIWYAPLKQEIKVPIAGRRFGCKLDFPKDRGRSVKIV